MPQDHPENKHDEQRLADELLRGVEAIADFTGEPVRRMRYLITRHGFPAVKRGGVYYTDRQRARAYYRPMDRT